MNVRIRVTTSAKQRGFWNFVVPAIAAVAGAALSSKSQKSAAEAQAQATLDANQANADAQREFAQMGIQWKVADAKAAGLHPLYALSGSGASFSPSFQVAPREAPTDYSWLTQLGQLLGGYIGNEQRKGLAGYSSDSKMYDHPTMDELQGVRVNPIKGLESQIEGVPLGWEVQDARGNWGVPVRPGVDPLAKDWVSSSANSPFWQRFAFGSGFNVILPKTSEPQEVFEDKPLWFWAMVAKANVKEYGPGWLTKARQQFPSLREVYDGVVQELKSSGLWFGK